MCDMIDQMLCQWDNACSSCSQAVHKLACQGQTIGIGRTNYEENNSPTPTSRLMVTSELEITLNDLWLKLGFLASTQLS